VANPRESKSEEVEAEATEEEFDNTLLTRMDIPKIVEAVLSNLPVENSYTTDDSGDNLHLGK